MWRFRELGLGEIERDPHEAEFFHLTSISEALVREVIQNSLDARSGGSESVRVRFDFKTVAKQDVEEEYLLDLVVHLRSSGLLPEGYENSSELRFLVIEDFGTTGLDGPTGEDGQRPADGSNFFGFWWQEGKSRKSGRKAGRWGLGKTTFHLASQLRSFWGCTVREDDQRELLMGKSLLKTHRLNGTNYDYYGHYSTADYNPIEDVATIQRFRDCFPFRRQGQAGFSLIIPLPNEDIVYESVVRSVISQYFYAIMRGMLVVVVNDDSTGDSVVLRREDLNETASVQAWDNTIWKDRNVSELLQFVEEAISKDEVVELIPSDETSPKITEDSFGENMEVCRSDFSAGRLMGFRLPVTIERQGLDPVRTSFSVFLKRFPLLSSSDEFYVRSGITIVDVRAVGNRPIRGLMVAEDSTVTEFLGDCETPAHTNWNERTEGFKDKYKDAGRKLRFIKNSVKNIVVALDLPPTETQKDFLKDVFFVPVDEPEERPEEPQKPVTPPSDVPEIPKKPNPFVMTKIKGGFRLSLGEASLKLPFRARISAAYDVRRGNPFSTYHLNDFDFGGDAIDILCAGCNVLSNKLNRIEIEVTDTEFNLTAKGFDSRRDIIANVSVLKNEA